MGDYWFSRAAEQDLRDIASYGDEQFGTVRSDLYRERLKARFSLLAEQPLLYPAVDHIRPGYRRSVCGVHSIYYRIRRDGVEIVRVIHHQDFE